MDRRTATKTIGVGVAGGWVLSAPELQASRARPPRLDAQGKSSQAASANAPASESVRIGINQCGYRLDAVKVATIALPPGVPDGLGYTVESSAGEVVLRGTLQTSRTDAASGDRFTTVDFSKLRAPGTYVVRAANVASDPVHIDEHAYATALRLAMRAFYGQRCGTKVDLGDGYKHGECHKHGEFHPSSGKRGKLKNRGGWHDAGDYGRYVVNSGISTATLLWAWEMFPAVLQPLTLNIPESGGKTPDFLAEVRWNLDWMRTLQDADTGGVWHKQTSEAFCGFVMPEKDKLPSEVIGTGSAPFQSTCATADFAAVMAIAARCYRACDAKFAAACLDDARKAYAWALANPDVTFKNPPGVTTGEYGDHTCTDELLWAAAELFRTTGESAFRTAFEAAVPATLTVATPGWNNMQPFAVWTYAMTAQGTAPEVRDRIVSATVAAARQRM